MADLKAAALQLRALTVFRRLLADPVLKAFLGLLEAERAGLPEKIEMHAQFTHLLFNKSQCLTRYVWQAIQHDENVCLRKKARKEPLPHLLMHCMEEELNALQKISQIKAADIWPEQPPVFLPAWETDSSISFAAMYKERLENLFVTGYGIYLRNIMFTYTNGEISPAAFPDSIQLESLTGYKEERGQVLNNTRAFLAGKPAANTLLYGDAGTGKSSTVKAVVNRLAARGLRLIELRKSDLPALPALMANLSANPLKFIIFIDDLSFACHNEEIGTLKAVLEGSVSAKAPNVLVYATSNRRHLVKESFSDRGSDDVHRNETVEEQTSLSDRFGLSVLFGKPGKEEYLRIVRALLAERGIPAPENWDVLAERHALARGRSGRTARQFTEQLESLL